MYTYIYIYVYIYIEREREIHTQTCVMTASCGRMCVNDKSCPALCKLHAFLDSSGVCALVGAFREHIHCTCVAMHD